MQRAYGHRRSDFKTEVVTTGNAGRCPRGSTSEVQIDIVVEREQRVPDDHIDEAESDSSACPEFTDDNAAGLIQFDERGFSLFAAAVSVASVERVLRRSVTARSIECPASSALGPAQPSPLRFDDVEPGIHPPFPRAPLIEASSADPARASTRISSNRPSLPRAGRSSNRSHGASPPRKPRFSLNGTSASASSKRSAVLASMLRTLHQSFNERDRAL